VDFLVKNERLPKTLMKICDVTQFYSPKSGGVRRYVSEKRRYVRDHTMDEHYLVVPGERTERLREGRLHLFTIKSPRIDRTSRYRLLCNTRLLREYLCEVQPDVIEAGDPYHVAWSLIKTGREIGVPVFGFYHSHFPDAYLRTILKYCGALMRDIVLQYAQDYIVRLYNQFHRTLVPSSHLRDLLCSWGVTNAVHTRLGVDTDSFTPGPALGAGAPYPEWPVPAGKRLLLYVGRLAGEKNVETLFEAYRLLQRRHPDLWLLIVGDGPLGRLLPRLMTDTGTVSWKSYIDCNETLREVYRAATVFVHPGVVETFGLVSLEAQACGCPVVGIRGTNMDSNIMAGLPHWATANTPAALAAAVERVLDHDPQGIGKLAAECVHQQFSWPTVLRPLWEIYQQATPSLRHDHSK
jgi:alpha-1,6-mannosyltransferase